MVGGKLRKLNEFEWASAAQYIMYISALVGLAEINSNHVVSFGLGRLGLDRLLKQKEHVLKLLVSNKSKLEAFVGRRSEELTDNEKAVLRTMYVQHQRSESTVRGHIALILDCEVQIELALLDIGGTADADALY